MQKGFAIVTNMNTATRKQFIDRCEALGISYEIETGVKVAIDLPHGKVLATCGLHFEDRYLRDTKIGYEYAFLIEDMAMGIEDCQIVDCDCCNEQID